MKKKIALILAIVLSITMFTACNRPTPEAPEPNHIYEAPPFSLETTEPDHEDADLDYWDFIRPLGSLLNGETWATPTQIPVERLLLWFLTYEREINAADITRFTVPDEPGFHIPAAEFEERVYQYFEIPFAALRDSDTFNYEDSLYVIDGSVPNIHFNYILSRVEEAGNNVSLTLSSVANPAVPSYTLVILRGEGRLFRFVSLFGPDGVPAEPVIEDDAGVMETEEAPGYPVEPLEEYAEGEYGDESSEEA